jgi:hypothetical protein
MKIKLGPRILLSPDSVETILVAAMEITSTQKVKNT